MSEEVREEVREAETEVDAPDWSARPVRIMLEEDAVFTADGVRYLDGRQKRLLLIGPRDDAGADRRARGR